MFVYCAGLTCIHFILKNKKFKNSTSTKTNPIILFQNRPTPITAQITCYLLYGDSKQRYIDICSIENSYLCLFFAVLQVVQQERKLCKKRLIACKTLDTIFFFESAAHNIKKKRHPQTIRLRARYYYHSHYDTVGLKWASLVFIEWDKMNHVLYSIAQKQLYNPICCPFHPSAAISYFMQ